MRVHYHRRERVYPSHIVRVFRPMGGGLGLVIWRHEVAVLTAQPRRWGR